MSKATGSLPSTLSLSLLRAVRHSVPALPPIAIPLRRAMPPVAPVLSSADMLRKRLLERPAPAIGTNPVGPRAPSASPPKSRLRNVFGVAIPSTGAPSPDGLDWTADRELNPFVADVLPTHTLGPDEEAPGASSPELARSAFLRGVVQPTIAQLSTREREVWLATLPSPIRVAMDQPYGKPDTNHVFTNDKCLRQRVFGRGRSCGALGGGSSCSVAALSHPRLC